MGKQIHTKWHRLRELILADEVYAPTSEVRGTSGHSDHWSEVGCDLSPLVKTIEQGGGIPKFVVDPELVKLATEQDFVLSLWDMKKAGVMHLPFPSVIVEYEGNGGRVICILSETGTNGNPFDIECDFYGVAFYLKKDVEGEYLVIPGSYTHLNLTEIDGELIMQITGVVSAWMNPDDGSAIVERLYRNEGGNVSIALFAVMLLMSTQGVEKEVIDPTPLNRNRRAAGKPLIPHHTYIHIGHVYNKDGTSTRYDARKSPRPHWRRGHIRNVRHGAGRKQTKPVYIAPMLVSWHGDEIAEGLRLPEYDVRK